MCKGANNQLRVLQPLLIHLSRIFRQAALKGAQTVNWADSMIEPKDVSQYWSTVELALATSCNGAFLDKQQESKLKRHFTEYPKSASLYLRMTGKAGSLTVFWRGTFLYDWGPKTGSWFLYRLGCNGVLFVVKMKHKNLFRSAQMSQRSKKPRQDTPNSSYYICTCMGVQPHLLCNGIQCWSIKCPVKDIIAARKTWVSS